MGDAVGVLRDHGLLVGGEIALEPPRLAAALEHQQVGANAVEEEAVVADHHGAAGEVDQRLFEHAHRVDVEVVGRFVQEDEVSAPPQHFRQVDAVPLAAGALADLFLLLLAAEVEAGDVGRASSSTRRPTRSCPCRR